MIDFKYSDEQTQIIAAVVSTLNAEPVAPDPLPWSTGIDLHPETSKLGPLGWLGIAAPEIDGGSHGTVIEEALVAREYGRCLISPDVVATAIAGTLLQSAGDEDGARSLIDGTHAAAFGMPFAPRANGGVAGWTIIQAGPVSHYLLLNKSELHVARAAHALALNPCIDPPLRTISLTDADVALHKNVSFAPDALGGRVLVLLGAMLTGVAEASCVLAVEYAKTRKQFGRLIRQLPGDQTPLRGHARARAIGALASVVRVDVDR